MDSVNLVTGGAGYLGSCLAKKLLSRGAPVRILDVQKTKYLPEGVDFVQADMRDAESCRRAMIGVSTVFHIAFVQSFSKLDERTQRDIDIGGTRNFLEAATAEGVRRFVHASTIEIYGTHPPHPCPEDAPVDPVGLYGKLKWECEILIRDHVKRTGLPVVMLRMPTICGPGFYNHKPLLRMLDRVIDGKRLVLIGDGSTMGDFVHVDDVVEAFVLASERDEAVGEAFNISASASASHLDIVNAAKSTVDSSSRVVYVRPGLARLALEIAHVLHLDPLPKEQFGYLFHHNCYDIEKARRLLGYQPHYTACEATQALILGYRADRAYLMGRTC